MDGITSPIIQPTASIQSTVQLL
ncbi:uncharacterized protein FFE2_09649 [Fusarium fujikuroi]|nr:uncharacterized protein FFE2_09649 [Fusarium fujikuroi]